MAELILEYLKVIISWPVAIFSSILILAIKFKTPFSSWLENMRIDYRGATFTSSQSMQKEIPNMGENPPLKQQEPIKLLDVSKEKDAKVQNLVNLVGQWRTNAYLWEYRYLNYYLVFNTKLILGWLYRCPPTPIDIKVYDSIWRDRIPFSNERAAILSALKEHFLIVWDDAQISITPKGREYYEIMVKPIYEQLNQQKTL